MPRQPDVLTTDRLSLRRPAPQDAADVLAILHDPRVVEHNPSGRLADLEQACALIARWLEHWGAHGFGNCCVVERSTGRLVGNCGLRRTTAQGQPALNLMYRFVPDCWGRGYATEAAGALVDWAGQHLSDEMVLARVRPANHASQAVAVKVGLTRDPSLDEVGGDGLEWAYTSRPPADR